MRLLSSHIAKFSLLALLVAAFYSQTPWSDASVDEMTLRLSGVLSDRPSDISASAQDTPKKAQARGQDLVLERKQTGSVLVAELFTSQGCSSCPPADEVLTSLSSRADILALSWPVDYWDRLGWQDTFASPLFSRRQKAYNKRLGRGGVYTPQLVINGKYQAIGSRRNKISEAIGKAASDALISPDFAIDETAITVTLPETLLEETAAIHLIWFLKSADVQVGQGENRGRRLHYTNVVRHSDWMADWSGARKSLSVPRNSLVENQSDGFAVVIQSGYGDGPVLGAGAVYFSR